MSQASSIKFDLSAMPAISSNTITKKLTINPMVKEEPLQLPNKSPIIPKKSFFFNRNPSSASSKSVSRANSMIFRTPLRGLPRKASLRTGSTEIENLRDSRYRMGGLVRTKSFTYGYSWQASESDFSVASGSGIHQFSNMNTMQRSLGVTFSHNNMSAIIRIPTTASEFAPSPNTKLSNPIELGEIHLGLLASTATTLHEHILQDLVLQMLEFHQHLLSAIPADLSQTPTDLGTLEGRKRSMSLGGSVKVPPVIQQVDDDLSIFDSLTASPPSKLFSLLRKTSSATNNLITSSFAVPDPVSSTLTHTNDSIAMTASTATLASRAPVVYLEPELEEEDLYFSTSSLYRYLEVTCAFCETLQLQGKEEQAITLFVQTMYWSALYVTHYLSAQDPVNLDDEEDEDGSDGSALSLSFDDTILQHMQDLLVHLNSQHHAISRDSWQQQSLALATLQPDLFTRHPNTPLSPTNNSNTASKVTRQINLTALEQIHGYGAQLMEGVSVAQLCTVLARYEQVHTLYALTNIFHRCCAALKALQRYEEAIVVAQTAVHLYEVVAGHYDDHNMGLASCTSLLASLLVQTGAIDQAVELDKRAVDLSSKIPLFSV